jgi:hypothetical protein
MEVTLDNSDSPILADVRSWIEGFVARPHPALGGFPPCPFARKALMEGGIFWRVCAADDFHSALGECALAVERENKQVSICIYKNPRDWNLSRLEEFVMQWRQAHASRDLTLLRDHPDDVEVVHGVKMNHGEYLLFFVQRLSHLTQARKELANQGYYESWSAEEMRSVLGGPSRDE